MDRYDKFLLGLGSGALLAFVVLVTATVWSSMAKAQDTVPRPDGLPPASANTNLQTGIGLPEILADSVPGEPVQLGNHGGTQPQPTAVLRPSTVAAPAAPQVTDPMLQARLDLIASRAQAEAQLQAVRQQQRLLEQSTGGMNQWDALVLMSQATTECIAESAKDKAWYTRIATIKSACGGTQEAYIMAVCTQVVQDTGDARDLGHCTQLMTSIKAGNKEMALAAIQWGGRILMAGTLGHYAAPLISDAIQASADKWNIGIGAASKPAQQVQVPVFAPTPTVPLGE